MARDLALFILALALSIGASIGLAKLGHPGALWFWRDILGVIA